jgi:hypothetical protein
MLRGYVKDRGSGDAGATDSGENRRAGVARRECLDVLAEDLDEFR